MPSVKTDLNQIQPDRIIFNPVEKLEKILIQTEYN